MIRILAIVFVCSLTLGISRAESPPSAKVLFDFADAAAMGGWEVEDDVKTKTQSRFMIADGRGEAFWLEVASIRLE